MKKITIITSLYIILLALIWAMTPALSLDQVVKLYICQTEHELEEITAWEYADPPKYRQATRNGTVMPLDAARERAGSLVSNDTVQCDADNQVVIKIDGNEGTARTTRLNDHDLEQYCPRTIKKYGHPCK